VTACYYASVLSAGVCLPSDFILDMVEKRSFLRAAIMITLICRWRGLARISPFLLLRVPVIMHQILLFAFSSGEVYLPLTQQPPRWHLMATLQ
jgi:hypothetical protein